MIKYDKLWDTMKKRGISQYNLYTDYGVERSLLDRLRHNKNIEIYTLDRLCTILECDIGDIAQHVPDEEPPAETPGAQETFGAPKESTPESKV